MKWGGHPHNAEPAVHMTHKRTKKVVDASWRPPANGKPFSFDDIELVVSRAYAKERAAMQAAFKAARRGN
jgi:hypothetical protein